MMATSYYKLEIENRNSVGKKASKKLEGLVKYQVYCIIEEKNQ